jgi:hypothetical protein
MKLTVDSRSLPILSKKVMMTARIAMDMQMMVAAWIAMTMEMMVVDLIIQLCSWEV